MRCAGLTFLLLLQACASGPAPWAPTERPSPVSCNAPGASATAPWILVTGAGFTFCVPHDWRLRDSHRWEGGGGSIRWGTGPLPLKVFRPDDVSPAGVRIPGSTSRDLPPVGASEGENVPLCSTRLSKERIDGQTVDLRDTDCDGKHYTDAQWPDSSVFLQGEAHSVGTASLQLMVYRTVRFLPPVGR